MYITIQLAECMYACHFLFFSFAKQFGHADWQGYGSFIHRWTKRYGIVNKAICGSKELAAPQDELETWKETVLLPTLAGYASHDIYNGDETALFYKSLPHRTYCLDGEKPAGFAKCKDRLTLLLITNMDGSDHRKLSVIGKAKNPRCLKKKYKMQVKDMAVNWYASKNAWMTGEIHHQIMSKFNNQMRMAGRHVLYVCDNASSHKIREYSHIKFLMLPPNATSIMQPLDQGIILSTKRRYKKKLAERYLVCVENDKDAHALLKSLDIVAATNMIAGAWRETSSTIIQNCFRKAGFKHHEVDPATEPEEPPVAPAPHVWNKIQKWLGNVQFDEFAASEPEAPTTQPMTDEDIINLVRTENDAPEEESDEEDDVPTVTAIKNSTEFLTMIDQQRAFLKRYKMPTDIVEQLEAQVIANQFSLCSKQKQMNDYFKSALENPKRDYFKTVADATKDVSLVDSLDIDDLELESIDTTVASVTVSTLMRNEVPPGAVSTPKRPVPCTTSTPKPILKKLKLSEARDKVMAMNNSEVSSLESDSFLSSQE